MKRSIMTVLVVVILLLFSPTVYAASAFDVAGAGTQLGSSTQDNTTPPPTAKPTQTSSPKPTQTPAPSQTAKPERSSPVVRNSVIEKIIGKELYRDAKGAVDSALYYMMKSGFPAYSAEYENVSDQTVDVRFDENTNEYAAVIELRWTYDLDGSWKWHSWYYTYVGSYVDSKVIVDSREEITDEGSKAAAQVKDFWKNNWDE